MDINKEREAFEKHASKFFTDSKEAFKTNGDQYLYDEVIWMWDCWIERAKAQAVPEGFVLVEKKILLEGVNKIEQLFEDDPLLALGELLPIQQGLKAMIEAQEPTND